ncbi:hypothetical protein F441_13599 [Phytophthora nicotianae CJ01A1]|uniref:Uncharacterized protein n=6 Tax=Phytophthora nicotianae TaxID=4792 RepID=W2R5K7_PHYN3|nr:hypothetical protein PPTG_21350 [Phytophthora nicotianae INRA-310]ETI41084.1 hypothetical protein F443_13666 [Phytophthora nicotianae P1569]ETK81134.1 hypothetical protein L915_13340 [Phytophthora nicotianae]ETO69723.1 hypothetical protein F444_13733 [Phytophthora nicotianae P1976]ETP10822.1 hypothetical protein F441_13599 [Phytophthora nicotianae CJ01A1]ETP38963.1 hypothetical protein F442_13533 [Phytophthora nicotianae P10297]
MLSIKLMLPVMATKFAIFQRLTVQCIWSRRKAFTVKPGA